MEKIRLDIVGLTSGQSSGTYTLILGELTGGRKLPIVIGSPEAQAIAVEIENIVPFRPMTHDLFVSFCKTFNVEVTEVNIHSLTEGVFYSRILCRQNGASYEIDARTSDSIALAVRFKCPIFTTAEIMKAAGIVLEDEDAEQEPVRADRPHSPGSPGPKVDDDYHALSLDELNSELEKALRVEDYARAAMIRDEINRRK